MSDRFVFEASKEEFDTIFGVSSERNDYFEPDYNITPGSLRLIVIEEQVERQLKQAQWGLIPPGSDKERAGREQFALPAEEISENKEYAECLNQRRCLVPTSGFYKWKTTKKKQTPFYIRLLSNRLTAFAGIYSLWESASGRDVYSFAILTTKANTLIEPLDDRMPVLLKPEHFKKWLADGVADDKMRNELLHPYPLTDMAVNRVSEDVNDINGNGPKLIQPIPK